ncbi:MAG TPA: LCP family protein [Propionibacteriaceae bacterium]|nr:LCP family protein [Propionibacteriaceae bacterium]
MANDQLPFFDDDSDKEASVTPPAAAEAATESPDAVGVPAEAADRPRRRRGRRVLIGSLSILGVLVLAVAGVLGYYLKSVDNALSQAPRADILPTVPGNLTAPSGSGGSASPGPKTGIDVPAPDAANAMNIVIMGSDSRGTDRGRSDTLILMHISGDRKKVYLISFPRDMWVSIPGYGNAKINAAYSWGGPTLAIQTLENLVHVRVDHAAITDFTGFTDLVDVIGGISVYNNQASRSDGVTFPMGQLNLNGKDALIYTRERYDLANGDLDRAARQRDVIKAIFKKVLTPEVLANPSKFNAVAQKIAPNVTVDSGFTNAAIEKLALSMRVTSVDDVRSLQAPVSGFAVSADGQDYDVVNTPVLAQLATALANDQMELYWQQHKNDQRVTAP